MAAILEEPLPESYQSRIEMLHRHNVALWDVLHTARREGSLDSNIGEKRPNDLASFLNQPLWQQPET